MGRTKTDHLLIAFLFIIAVARPFWVLEGQFLRRVRDLMAVPEEGPGMAVAALRTLYGAFREPDLKVG